MTTPYEIAKKAWKTPCVKGFEEEDVIDSHICADDHGKNDCWFEIMESGWIRIDDNANGEGAVIKPETLKELCHWYLGVISIEQTTPRRKYIRCMLGFHKPKNTDGRGMAGKWSCERCGKLLSKAIVWPRPPARPGNHNPAMPTEKPITVAPAPPPTPKREG